MTIGKAISTARNACGFTQEQLSDITGLSRSYICDIENDRYNPSVKVLTLLAVKLKLDLNFLLQNDGNTSKNQSPTTIS